MSVSKVCEPCCKCIGDHCPVSKRVLHIAACILWIGGIFAVNAKLIIYMMTVSKGNTDQYQMICLPDSNGNNRTWIPFSIGAILGLIQVPWIYRFVRRNYTRIENLPINDSYLISQHKSCYECYFLSFLLTVCMIFVMLDVQLCGDDNYSEIVPGSKCVYIGLDACVGVFLLFGFSGFIVSFLKGGVKIQNSTQLIEDDYTANGDMDDEERRTSVI